MLRFPTLALAAAMVLAATGLAAAGPAPTPSVPNGEEQRQQDLFTATSPAPDSHAQDRASWEAMARTQPDFAAMMADDPHPAMAHAMAAAAEAAARQQHTRDVAQWNGLYSRAPFPNMGLGGHGG